MMMGDQANLYWLKKTVDIFTCLRKSEKRRKESNGTICSSFLFCLFVKVKSATKWWFLWLWLAFHDDNLFLYSFLHSFLPNFAEEVQHYDGLWKKKKSSFLYYQAKSLCFLPNITATFIEGWLRETFCYCNLSKHKECGSRRQEVVAVPPRDFSDYFYTNRERDLKRPSSSHVDLTTEEE